MLGLYKTKAWLQYGQVALFSSVGAQVCLQPPTEAGNRYFAIDYNIIRKNNIQRSLIIGSKTNVLHEPDL